MLAIAKEETMTVWIPCSREDGLWKLARMAQFHKTDNAGAFRYAHENSGGNGTDPGADYIHFWAVLATGNCECPDYFDREYFKLPMKVRKLATAG